MRFSLQQMIAQTMKETEARTTKLAQAQAKSEAGKPEPPASQEQEKTASRSMYDTETVIKVANALTYVLGHIDEVAWDKVAEVASESGPGKGPNALGLNEELPTATQPQDMGSSPQKAVPMAPGMEASGSAATNPQTAMKTDETEPKPAGPQPQTTNQAGTKVAALRQAWNMRKQAAEDTAAVMGMTEPKDPPLASRSGEGGMPMAPAVQQKADTNIGSNQAAIDTTKTKTQTPEAALMNSLLNEPVQVKTKDPAITKNLEQAKQASMARQNQVNRLMKIAQSSCSGDASPEDKEKASRLTRLLAEKAKEKEKTSMFPAGQAPMSPPPSVGM